MRAPAAIRVRTCIFRWTVRALLFVKRENENRVARGDGHLLLAAAQVGDRISVDRGARWKRHNMRPAVASSA